MGQTLERTGHCRLCDRRLQSTRRQVHRRGPEPGARHKFDLDSGRRINLPANTKTKEGCPLEYDIVDLKMRDRRSADTRSQDKVKELSRELCADKGSTVEGDRHAREAAGKAVIVFLNKFLK